MLLSGSVGYTLFEKDNKKVLVFADVHDGVDYCSEDSHSIAEYLKKNFNKKQIILEETIPENFLGKDADKLKLQDLWPNSKHTQELKKLAFKNKDTIQAVDIRPILIPFSWELANSNELLSNFVFGKYIQFIDAFFKKKSILFKNIINKELSKLDNIINNKSISHLKTSSYYLFLPLLLFILNKLKSTDKDVDKDVDIDVDIDDNLKIKNNIEKTKILDHINEIHEMFIHLKLSNQDDFGKSIKYFINNKINVLHEINYILSLIMEWYMILLVSNITKDSIIHTGLAHSSNLVNLLEKYYSYKKISEYGMNDIKSFNESNMPLSCIKIPTNVTDKFNRKFGLFI